MSCIKQVSKSTLYNLDIIHTSSKRAVRTKYKQKSNAREQTFTEQRDNFQFVTRERERERVKDEN